METYEKYKPSGIDWIGEVPEHWEQCRFKNFIQLITKPSNSLVKIGLENIESGSGCFIQTDSEFEGSGVEFLKNDVVYGKLRPYLQKVWLASFDGNAVGDFFVFRVKSNSNATYLKYLLLSDGFTREADGATFGAKMPRVSSDFIMTLRYFLPPLAEQEAIAAYLDARCADIDKVVATQQKRIALLQELKQSKITQAVTHGLNPDARMKDSGVEWIGMVPEHWEVMKLNHVCETITDFVASGSFASLRDNVPYLAEPDYAMLVRTADLSGSASSDSRVYISKKSYEFLSNSNLFGGELLLPNIGSVGNVYMVPDDLYPKMSLAPNAIMVKTKYNDRYYYYYFMSKSGKDSIINLGQGTAQAKFNKTELRALKVALPPMDEQASIAEYLDRRCGEIDKQIGAVTKQIELLREYKQALITEVVTGKRKV